jgi:hypothetical protein
MLIEGESPLQGRDIQSSLARPAQRARAIRGIEKRKQIVWQIEKILARDVARPIIYHNHGATCWQPHVEGHVQHENSPHKNWRFDSVWLDR